MAAIILAMSGAGIGLVAESALPETLMYPAKIGLEQLEGLAAVTPTEQAQVRLNLAASRLAEADVELKAGNTTMARALLGQVDAEIAGAGGILAAHGLENPSQIKLGRQIETLGVERDRVSARVEPKRSVADASDHPGANASDPAKLEDATFSSVEPKLSSTVATAIFERAKPVSPAATVVDADATTVAAKVETDARSALIDRSVRLSRLLIVQVQAGDGENATVTAQDFAEVIHKLSASDNDVKKVLRQERISFIECLATATPSTRGALQVALSSIDNVLGGAVAESHSGTAAKVPTSGHLSMVVSANPAPGSSKVVSRSKANRDSPISKLPVTQRASISLPAVLGISVSLGSPPAAPPTVSPEGARSSDHEANGSSPGDSHAKQANTFTPIRPDGHSTEKPVGDTGALRTNPDPPGNTAGAHSLPPHPAETLAGASRLPPLTSQPAQ